MKQSLLPFIMDGERTGLHFDPVNEMLYVNQKIGGVRHRFSTGFRKPDYRKAKAFANKELSRRLKMGRVKLTAINDDTLDQYLLVKESEGLKPDTLKNVRNAVKQIRGFWGPRYPHEITRDVLPEWYLWFKLEYPGQQMENAIKYMRNYSRYLAEKIVDGRPLLPAVPQIRDPDYKKVRRERKKRKERILTSDEFQKIYRAAKNIYEETAALFMYTMGTRVTETLELRFGKEILLDQDPPLYCWSDGQNKADHVGRHAIHPSLIKGLTLLRSASKVRGTLRLFPQQRDPSQALKEQQIDWEGWRTRADLGWHWTPHTFRHTCLSNLFNDERNPQAIICKLYRVSLAVALETYVKPTESGIMKMRSTLEVAL